MPYVQGRLPTERQFGMLLGRCKDRPVHAEEGTVRLAVRFVRGKRFWRVDALKDARAAGPDEDVEREAIRDEAKPTTTN